MKVYELIQVPNQSFTTTFEDNVFEFVIRTFRGISYISCIVNDVYEDCGVPCVANINLFSKKVNNIAGGEFRFVASGTDAVDWHSFGTADCSFAFIPKE